ncbi:hypothetical protein H2200_004879 [Cladophialophora chaetospira]|uniref:Uncharacterized protein n=1 Tax=Cladophialophora chaetospira TaxID=386627 RepID=A0AA38XE50_9EURO|nr:hypothetical protein H2200_004879 [Cladophialophora chaetospira]
MQVHGSVLLAPPVPVVQLGKIPFRTVLATFNLRPLRTRPLSWWASDFSDHLDNNRLMAISLVRQISLNWAAQVRSRLNPPEQEASQAKLAEAALHCLLLSEDEQMAAVSSDFDYHELVEHVYVLVVNALSFSLQASRKAGLRLAIIKQETPTVPPVAPCIGLMRGNVDRLRRYTKANGEVLTVWFCSDLMRPARYAKFRVAGRHGYWLEVARLRSERIQEDEKDAEYEVVGAWVPTKVAPLGCIGGIRLGMDEARISQRIHNLKQSTDSLRSGS